MKTQATPHLDLIEHRLREIIQVVDEPHSLLFEAARYSLLLPAKRLRPRFLLAVLSDFDCPFQWGIDPACALEMVHTYSLIHDDLPCMDNDALRRGQPTLHKVYSEAQAILAGDYLLTYAFEVLAKAPHLLAEKKLKLIALLAERAGGNGMIGGQVIDILYEGKVIDSKTLTLMFAKKTAALFTVSLEFGAVIADLSPDDQKHLKQAGFAFGIGYQYIDDLLDLREATQDSGKSTSSDLYNDKATALTLYSEQEVRDQAHACYKEALVQLSLLSRPMPQLSMLLEDILNKF